MCQEVITPGVNLIKANWRADTAGWAGEGDNTALAALKALEKPLGRRKKDEDRDEDKDETFFPNRISLRDILAGKKTVEPNQALSLKNTGLELVTSFLDNPRVNNGEKQAMGRLLIGGEWEFLVQPSAAPEADL